MRKIRLAYWGSGPISNFHIPAFVSAGFEPVTVFSREGSPRLQDFGNRWKIPICASKSSFIDMCSIADGIVIALETSITPSAISDVLDLGKPIFIEKPAGLKANDLEQFKKNANFENLFFGYNRRYYSTALHMRDFLEFNDSCLIQVAFPDAIKSFTQFRINGCHIVDFLQFIAGKLEVVDVWGSLDANRNGFMVQFISANNHYISLALNWGAPENVGIRITGGGRSLHSTGFEKLVEYEGIDIIEPSQAFPLRQYIPRQIKSIEEPTNAGKPGFLKQAVAFRQFMESKRFSKYDCDLNQAISTLQTIDVIEMKLSN